MLNLEIDTQKDFNMKRLIYVICIGKRIKKNDIVYGCFKMGWLMVKNESDNINMLIYIRTNL